jgi:hypothetical protein
MKMKNQSEISPSGWKNTKEKNIKINKGDEIKKKPKDDIRV